MHGSTHQRRQNRGSTYRLTLSGRSLTQHEGVFKSLLSSIAELVSLPPCLACSCESFAKVRQETLLYLAWRYW